MNTRKDKLLRLLGLAFDEMVDQAEDGFEQRRRDFVFHMTDWLDDLERLDRLCSEPVGQPQHVARFLVGFLSHVPAHLNAAQCLLLGARLDAFADDGDSAT